MTRLVPRLMLQKRSSKKQQWFCARDVTPQKAQLVHLLLQRAASKRCVPEPRFSDTVFPYTRSLELWWSVPEQHHNQQFGWCSRPVGNVDATQIVNAALALAPVSFW
ncbi:hypothetical protein BAUCODRAFT_395923 [Baudoinia panamericana UAMH 10762]|uniref:Uncharacterized protein n=1 Tax=Baudoinia panamericana (strain UAMH 10762) TaxID=717646 RepID=M2NJC2_BAUPA|nr:uncharacterized protein BAUCODRAFT_395923 [Baudoinia panamericana UAMH 10762]EMC99240.1 hypothetical protein BAUCODRAFT_395923 [Baudoinia panamericana UAMH 10762]